MKALHRVTHEVNIGRVDEDQLGNIDRSETLDLELCSACRAVVGRAIDFVLRDKKGKR